MWLNPLAPSPTQESGMHFEENGFLDGGLSWPPPDPDKMPMQRHVTGANDPGFTFKDGRALTDDEYVVAFKRRQNDDVLRRRGFKPALRGPAANCGGLPGQEDEEEKEMQAPNGSVENWRNEEGEALEDYGVDEDDHEEDSLPLSELMTRRGKILR